MPCDIREADSRTTAPTVIGVLVSVAHDFQPFWLGAVDAAQARGSNVVCFIGGALSPADDSQATYISSPNVPTSGFFSLVDVDAFSGLVTWAGSGAGLGMHLGEAEMARFMARFATLPVVNYEGRIPGIPTVFTDTYSGMCELLDHLIEVHGRRRIALIRGPAGHAESEARVRAYRDTLTRHDIPHDPKLICPPAGWDGPAGQEMLTLLVDDRQLQPGEGFDAVATTEVEFAIGCLEGLHARGVRVPDQVAVVGYNDRREAQTVDPPITTMRKPFYASGVRAAEMVLAMIDGTPVPDEVELDGELILRRSCGCAAGPERPDTQNGAIADESPAVGSYGYGNQVLSASRVIMNATTISQLADLIAGQLPELHIADCFIVLHAEPHLTQISGPPHEWSRVILAMEHNKRDPRGMEGRTLHTPHSIAALLTETSQPAAWVAVPLYFSRRLYGVALFGVSIRDGVFYQALAHEIGSAVQSVLILPEYEQAKRSLRESEARMRTLIEHLPVAFWAKDTDGVYFMQNSVMREMSGDNQGMTLEEIAVDEALRAKWLAQDARVLAGETVHSEHTRRRDGEARVYQQIVAPVIVDGVVIAIQGLILDVTEQKRLEATLRQAKEEAEAANQVKSRFLATMSHELRTPLNAILGYTEMLARDPQLIPEQREHLGIIERSGSHLLGLINDVLDLAKIEAGKTELRETAFNLHEALLGLGEMFSLRAEEKGLSLVFDLGADVPRTIYADEGKLRQVLINLLSNAIKFTEEGGIRVTVAARPPEEAPESRPPTGAATESAPTMWLQFTVKDTGIGIAPEEMDLVFEAFDQTESGRRAGQGTGLGLPLSREYVRLMGGEMTLTSEVGSGTCFRFTLPVTVLRAAESREIQESPTVGMPSPARAEAQAKIAKAVNTPEGPDVDSAWVENLRRATVEGDIQWIARLVEQIRPSHGALADELDALAERYAHEEILDILKEVSNEL